MSLRHLSIAVAVLLAASTTVAAQPASATPPQTGAELERAGAFVGLEYNSASDFHASRGIDYRAGVCLADCAFAYEKWRVDGRDLLILNRGVGKDDKGNAVWRVIDAVVVPQRDGMESGSCSLAGETRSFVAFGKILHDGKQQLFRLSPVTDAFAFDLTAGRIVRLPTRGIECTEEDVD